MLCSPSSLLMLAEAEVYFWSNAVRDVLLPNENEPRFPNNAPVLLLLNIWKVVPTPASGWAGRVSDVSPRYPPRRVKTHGLPLSPSNTVSLNDNRRCRAPVSFLLDGKSVAFESGRNSRTLPLV